MVRQREVKMEAEPERSYVAGGRERRAKEVEVRVEALKGKEQTSS